MVSFKDAKQEDLDKFSSAINYVFKNFGNENVIFRFYKYKDEDRLLCEIGNVYLVISLEGKDMRVHSFVTDEKFNVTEYSLDEHEVLLEDGQIFRRLDNGFEESITLVETGENKEGVAVYSQYDPKSNVLVSLVYNHFMGSKRVYPVRIERPLKVVYQSKAKDNHSFTYYSAKDFDMYSDKTSFDIACIKDYGLEEFLSKGSFNLEKSDKMVRFFKTTKIGGLQFGGFPLGKQYTWEDLKKEIEEKGFQSSIPKEVLDAFNGDNKSIVEYRDVMEAISKIDETSNEVGYILKLGDGNNGSN